MIARTSAGIPLTSIRHRALLVSLIIHAGLIGLLLLSATRPPVPSSAPIRMRLLEPPAPSAPAPTPPPVEAPRGTSPKPEAPSQKGREVRPPAAERPRAPERPPRAEQSAPSAPSEAGPRVETPPIPASPPVVARPVPERPAPSPQPSGPTVEAPRQVPREAPLDALPPSRPERGGLSLGGPSDAAPPARPAPSSPGGSSTPRRSIRDQIAGLGTGLGEEDAPGKHTVHLDSQEPRFLDYLSRLKRRVERVWTYPEEAWSNGVSGELLILFTLNKAGTLTAVRLVNSSGFPILDQEALRAVKAAAPYEPFPPQLGDDPWNIAATFRYFLPPQRLRRN